MIPVLIAPAFNRHDLLEKMLASVDVEVGRTLLVDNGRNHLLDDTRVATHHRLNVTRWQPPFGSIGYGGAINFGITQTPDAEWWMWASNDVQFEPGFLASIIEMMGETMTPLVLTGGFTWGAINRRAVRAAGLVDDGFWPLYFDDNDYHYRCTLAGVIWIDYFEGWFHGDGKYGSSLTIQSDVGMRRANHYTFEINRDRYIAKWGGLPGSEVFKTPWDRDLPVSYVEPPDLDFRAEATRRWAP